MKRIFKIFREIGSWVSLFFIPKPVVIDKAPKQCIQYHDDLPDKLENDTYYLIGLKDQPWQLAFICPCGCGELIQLNLLKEANPCWTFKIQNNEITISPSIWRKTGCVSHFFVKKSVVIWTNPQI